MSKENKVEISLPQALEARKHLNKTRTQQGVSKPPLLRIGGDLLVPLYNIKNSIEVAFKADFDRIDDLHQELEEIQERGQEKAQKNPNALIKDILSKKDYNRYTEVQDMLVHSELNKEKYNKKINIPEKINVHELKKEAGVDVDEVSSIDFAVDFSAAEQGK